MVKIKWYSAGLQLSKGGMRMRIKVEDKEGKRKRQVLSKQLKDIEKQEEKILYKKENTFIKDKIVKDKIIQEKIIPLANMIQNKIPARLIDTLDAAFYKGFCLVFEKGNTYIEKTYNKDKKQLEFDLNNYAIDKKLSKKHIKKLDKPSNYSKAINSSIAVLEGGVLGLLGIGIPDIPLLIAVIVRTVNEIALSYGYQYEREEEKAYILYIICGAMTKGETQREFDQKINLLGQLLDSNQGTQIQLEEEMKITASILSESLLTAKFIQGIPVVGIVGGVVNHNIISKIGKYAKLKYKKRYLLKKADEI
jgi:hypothetical protein